jgi:hypothetical protein
VEATSVVEADDRHCSEDVLNELVYEHARVSGDTFPIDAQSWAIHGFIAVDGDVIMATFSSREEAQRAIRRLWQIEAESHAK